MSDPQVARSEAKFRALLEAAPDAIVIIDRRGRIELVNSQTVRLFGHSREAMIGQPVEMLVPLRLRGGHAAFRCAYIDSPRVRPMGSGADLYGLRQDGSEFPVEISLSPLEVDGELLVSSSIRDVTARADFARALGEKNAELERADLAKDRFLASMSHELRTPLNAIIGFTGTLLMELPGPLNAGQAAQLNIIETSATHLLSLINDILDLAKIESGKVEINLVPVSCRSLIDEVSASLRALAAKKDLSFDVVMPDDITLLTDRRALTQIIVNLGSNAIKYTEEGGVCISCRREPLAKQVEITIVDSGIGISTADQTKLFQAFSQLEATTAPSRRREGTGLGLHLSRKLAELIGGQITFSSEVGKGSTFAITFPEGP